MSERTTLVIPADRFAAAVAALTRPTRPAPAAQDTGSAPRPSPALAPQPDHIGRPQNPLPGQPPVMPRPTPPETPAHPGL